MKRLVILGVRGHAKVVADIAELVDWNEIHFFDYALLCSFRGFPWKVVGTSNDLDISISKYDGFIVGIGDNAIRAEKFAWLNSLPCNEINFMHSSAVVSKYAQLGYACVVMSNAAVNAGEKIGRGVILNTGSSVDYDRIIGDYAHINPGARLAVG